MVEAVRALYRQQPDPFDLIGKKEFTMTELQRLHEEVMGPVQRDQFRRYMLPRLVTTGEMTSGRNGRPARYFMKKEN